MKLTVLVLCLVAGAISAPLDEYLPALQEFQGNFNTQKINDGYGAIALKSGPVQLTLNRDQSGALAVGTGYTHMSELNAGMFGKITVQASTTLDGVYNALMDTQLSTGARAFNPLTLTVSQSEKTDGLQFSGSTDLGFAGGSFMASSSENTIPKFEVHLNTDNWLTAKAAGQIENGKVKMDSYIAGIDMVLASCSASWDGSMSLKNYEIGGSLGVVSGSVKYTKQDTDYLKSYKAGASLGFISLDMLVDTNNEKTYVTVLDMGLMKIKHTTQNEKQSSKGSIEISNFGVDYEVQEDGLQIGGGQIQVGSSVIGIHRDSNGQYQVTVKRGTQNS